VENDDTVKQLTENVIKIRGDLAEIKNAISSMPSCISNAIGESVIDHVKEYHLDSKYPLDKKTIAGLAGAVIVLSAALSKVVSLI